MIREIVFTDKKFMDSSLSRFCYYYENGKEGRVNYQGYNFPVYVLDKITNICDEEKWVKRQIQRKDVYIVGYMKGDFHTRSHELRHAEYYINDDIQKNVFNFFKSVSLGVKEQIIRQFKNNKYNERVWLDEFYAYMNDSEFWSKKIYNYIQENKSSYLLD